MLSIAVALSIAIAQTQTQTKPEFVKNFTNQTQTPFRSPMSRWKVENHTRQRPENNPRDKSPPTGE